MNRRGPKNVLLVDDDPDVLWGLGRCLTRNGFKVTTCADGAEAVPYLESMPCDILVTDVQMPNLNGLALLEWVRKNRPHIRVAVITAFGSEAVKNLSLRRGAILYLEKPLDPKLLIEVLDEASESSSFVGSINKIDLFDYVQLVLVTRRTVRLEVLSPTNERWMLYLREGRVDHAQGEDLTGEDAFYRCLSLEGGSFTSLPWEEPDEVSIGKDGEFMLLEAARIKDETSRGAEADGPAEQEMSLDLFGEEEKQDLF
jgi:CheY-like chemotaxis protein